MFVERIEVSGTYVAHVKECEDCERGIRFECLRHPFSNCPCSGSKVECKTCGGLGENWDDDCDCTRCIEAVAVLMAEAGDAS
jgi:hypothetical protein